MASIWSSCHRQWRASNSSRPFRAIVQTISSRQSRAVNALHDFTGGENPSGNSLPVRCIACRWVVFMLPRYPIACLRCQKTTDSVTIIEAITEFRAAAIAKADFAKPASEDHALHARMSRAFHSLVAGGSEGLAAFKALLHDESHHVRGWVAAQLLSQGDKSAVPIMKRLAADKGIDGFTAATTLQEFRAGRLRSPFPVEKGRVDRATSSP